MALGEREGTMWRALAWLGDRPAMGDVAAWLASATVHMIAIVALACVTLVLPIQQRVQLSALPVAELDEELLKAQEFHFSADPQQHVGALGVGDMDSARPSAPMQADVSEIAYDLESPPTVGEIQVQQFDRTIFTSTNLPEDVVVKGAGSVGASGAVGAVDRITHEILLSLDERPTLVVWLFDQSGSLKPQREAIAQRFDRIYTELGMIADSGNTTFKQHRDEPLLTAVAQFGSTVDLITPKPIGDLADIKSAVRSVSDDLEGKGRENVFQAVGVLAQKFRHHRLSRPRRNVMIVVFTDEAGDDIETLDAALEICRKLEMPVYVIGVPAPFGRQDAFVKWVDPDPNYDQSPQWVPVHQGPESLVPERVKLLFGGTQEEEEPLDSGYGPFGLCRLAYETGGLYFTVHPNRKVGQSIPRWETASMASHLASFFDPRVMRRYRPEYISAQHYYDFVKSNRASLALVEAARLSAITPMENVRLVFPRVDDAQFARDLSNAQRTAAKLEPQVAALVTVLRQGEADRQEITKPRWQAGFDLAIGRALAVKVRTEGYNAMLAVAKQGLKFKEEQSDTWELRPADTITTGSVLAQDAADAKMYLERVVTEHDGTPWALEAARELRAPLGWEWRERFTDVAGRMARAQQGNNNRPTPERPEPPAKPRRDPPAL